MLRRITWRNKSAEHNLDFKFQIHGGQTCVVASCNCGEVFADGPIVYASDVVFAYRKHMTDVLNKEVRRRRKRRKDGPNSV